VARVIEIRDLAAPELAAFAHLTEAQLRSRLEPEKGLFIAESPKVIRLALDAGCVPEAMLMERRHLAGQGAELMERCGDIPVYTADRAVLKDLTGYALTRGILCAMRRPAPRSVGEICRDARRVAVLENIVDSTNLGAIFRSAAALGVDAVLLSPSCADPLLRRAVRVSMGNVFLLPWSRWGERPEDWPGKAVGTLKEMGFRTAALALSGHTLPLDDPRLKEAEKLALFLGTEGDGLTPETVEACDYNVKIPMSRGVDSLNVAAAAAVAFWELRIRG
jgi:tRNA G18 (ribose-2'-O)-methylase SpoU